MDYRRVAVSVVFGVLGWLLVSLLLGYLVAGLNGQWAAAIASAAGVLVAVITYRRKW